MEKIPDLTQRRLVKLISNKGKRLSTMMFGTMPIN
jgi:hypothetical protein